MSESGLTAAEHDRKEKWMNDKLCHPEDALIMRDSSTVPGSIALCDCDGDCLFTFPEYWSDEQVFTALRFANMAYAMGVKVGSMQKAAAIRSALGIED
jgi:hypothetical protein